MGVVDTIIGIAQLVWLLLRLPFAILYDFYRTYFAPEKSIDKVPSLSRSFALPPSLRSLSHTHDPSLPLGFLCWEFS